MYMFASYESESLKLWIKEHESRNFVRKLRKMFTRILVFRSFSLILEYESIETFVKVNASALTNHLSMIVLFVLLISFMVMSSLVF